MNLPFNIINEYLDGKPVYPLARRILNLLFSVSITSFLFEKFYFKYQWISITDYKGMLDFLVKGYFFVPLCLFLIVHYTLLSITYCLFVLMTMRKSNKLLKWIYKLEFKQADSQTLIHKINTNPLYSSPIEFDETNFFALYNEIVNNIPPEQLIELEGTIKKQRNVCEKNFYLVIKSIICITVYFFIVPYFGWLLFSLSVFILLLLALLLYFSYLLLDIVPSAIKKFHFEVSKYMEQSVANLQNSKNV